MLYWLVELSDRLSVLNVFRYITVRTAVASISALLLSLLMGPWVIERLRALQVQQYIREEGPKAHQKKAGTPTMGGVLIVAAIVIPTFLWADLRNSYVLLAIGATVAFGTIGFVDDYNKVVRKRSMGLTPRAKFGYQVLTCAVVGVVLLSLQTQGAYSTQLSVPFFKRLHPNLVITSIYSHHYIWPLAFIPLLLFLVQRAVRRLPWNPENSRCRGTGHFLRLAGRRFTGFSLVQRASRGNVHGRCGLAGARRRDRSCSSDHQAGNSAAFDRRRIRARSALRHYSGGFVQADRQARVSHGSAAPPFRIDGLERIENHRQILDRGAGVRAVFVDHAKIALGSRNLWK